MLTAYQIDVLRDQSAQLLDPVVECLIEDIAKRVSQAGQLTSTAAYQVWRAQNLGTSQRKLKKELQKRLKISLRDVEKLLTQAAETGYNFDISRLPTGHAVPFFANSNLQQILDTTVKMAQDDLSNIIQTIGFVCPDGEARPLTKAYHSACDFAFNQVTTGARDIISAVREATKGLVQKGILSIDYESGVHTSIEAAVRRNIMGGLGLMQEQISQQNHDALECNGWEISAHAGSAPDHEPIQGKQYTDAEYTQLNNSLLRRIGTLNCGHSASPILYGLTEPQYSNEELEQFRKDNETGVTYGDKHYTLYEATQHQRRLERTIRKQKRKILIAEAAGDEERLQHSQIKLVRLKEEYNRFSEAAGLRTQHERMETAGFTWKHGKTAEKTANEYYAYWSQSIGANESAKTLADYYEMKYNKPDEYRLLKQYAKDVKKGWVSPLSGFENYKTMHRRIETEIVGCTAADGTKINGQVPHFIQRVIGTMVDPEKLEKDLQIIRRSGVNVDDIKAALFNPEIIDPPVKRGNGKTSVRFIGENCVVTINPDEGTLIQTNPRKVKR